MWPCWQWCSLCLHCCPIASPALLTTLTESYGSELCNDPRNVPHAPKYPPTVAFCVTDARSFWQIQTALTLATLGVISVAERRPARRKQEELSQICLLRPISTLLLAQIKPLLCPSLVQQQQCQVACLTHFPTRPLPLQLLLDLASDGPVLATFRQHLLPLPHPKHRVQPTMSWISSLLPLQVTLILAMWQW